ncbi:MAG: dCTP deaminase, partial [Waterburya sp.]
SNIALFRRFLLMTILSAQSIRLQKERMHEFISPFCEAKVACGMSYGLSSCGYDIRLGGNRASYVLKPGDFLLGVSLERFHLPAFLCGIVHDKSTLARMGIAMQNTVLEPGWAGYITLEISNHGKKNVTLLRGQPIAQVLFHMLDHATEIPYEGKYQNQPPKPVEAIRV